MTADEPAAVSAVIQELCGRQEVRPQDVVVLSGHGRDKSLVYNSKPGRWRFTDTPGRRGNALYFSSIRAFKGLEAQVVILCELGNLQDDSRDSQLYVGVSRARSHCVVVAPAPPPD